MKFSLQTPIRRIAATLALMLIASESGAWATLPVSLADSIVVVVSATSSVTEISRLHLADIYLGRTSHFENGTPAVPIDRNAGSADRISFSEKFLDRSEAQMKAHWSRVIFTGRGRPPREASSGQAVRNIVAGDPRAIGYIDVSLVDARVRVLRVR
jgi:ABC-type phosphate transport system substrate-binding protein